MKEIRDIEKIKSEIRGQLTKGLLRFPKERQISTISSYISEVSNKFITLKYGSQGFRKGKEEIHLLKELCDYCLDLCMPDNMVKYRNRKPLNLDSKEVNTSQELMELLVLSNRLGHHFLNQRNDSMNLFFDIKHQIESLILDKSNRDELEQNGIRIYTLNDSKKKTNKDVLLITQPGYPISSVHFSRDLLTFPAYRKMYDELPKYQELGLETSPYISPYKYTNNPSLLYNPKAKYLLEQNLLVNSNNKLNFLSLFQKDGVATDFQIFNTLSVMGLETQNIKNILSLLKSNSASKEYYRGDQISTKKYELSLEGLDLEKLFENLGIETDKDKFIESFKNIEDAKDKNLLYRTVCNFVLRNPKHDQNKKWKSIALSLGKRNFLGEYLKTTLSQEIESPTKNITEILEDIGVDKSKDNLKFVLNCNLRKYKDERNLKKDEGIRDTILELVALKQSTDNSEETMYWHDYIMKCDNPIVMEKYQEALEKFSKSKKEEKIDSNDQKRTVRINESELRSASTTNEFLDNFSNGVKTAKAIDESQKKHDSPDDD